VEGRVGACRNRSKKGTWASTTTGDGGNDHRGASLVENPDLPVSAVALWLSIRTMCGARTPSKSSSVKAPSPAAVECSSGRRSIRGSRACRTLPEGVDHARRRGHPDWTGPDDLVIKIKELREITDWEKPIYVKVGATRVFNDVKLAVHAGADCHRGRRYARRHGGNTKPCSSSMWNTYACRPASGRRRVGRSEHARHRAIGDFRRNPQRRGWWPRRSPWARCGGDRAGCAGGIGLQPAISYIAGGQHVSALEDYARLAPRPGSATTVIRGNVRWG